MFATLAQICTRTITGDHRRVTFFLRQLGRWIVVHLVVLQQRTVTERNVLVRQGTRGIAVQAQHFLFVRENQFILEWKENGMRAVFSTTRRSWDSLVRLVGVVSFCTVRLLAW